MQRKFKLTNRTPAMTNLLKTTPLDNGLTVAFFDQSRHYYGDFYRAALEVSCTVPVTADCFPTAGEYAAAREDLGETICYRRTMEQMGVPAAEVPRVLARLMDNFERHSQPYFAQPSFPCRIVLAEWRKVRERRNRSIVTSPTK
jgi:hypothetical protein